MTNTDIFLGSGASITFVPENDLFIGVGLKDGGAALDGSSQSVIQVNATFDSDFELITDLYKGCILERYNTSDVFQSNHRITSNDANSFTISPAVSAASTDYFVVNSYGAPVPAPVSTAKRLLSDQWLGILESATFPTTEVEMKQTNLSLGGSRNFTYQYKGITSFSGGNLAFVSNHAAWLYYFLGKCTTVTCSTDALATALSTDSHRQTLAHGSSDNDSFLIRSMDEGTSEVAAGDDAAIGGIVETGPIFRRTVGNKICPPISPFEATDAQLDFYHKLDRPTGTTTLSKAITYTFTEQDGDLLPSFALEQNLSKLTGTNLYRTNNAASAEDLNFVKIARGCRVNTLTMTANENEEVKMTLDLSTRNVHELAQDEVYDARRGVTDETSFINYESSTNAAETREPFFFSDGTFKLLGNTFLKINSLTLTMNNNLQDRRFLGVGSKNIQESIPGQRTYEISFTGHVTDDALYTALLNDAEDTTQTIELIFTKSNGENITLKFEDYFISANNFPIPDDKGPVVVEATVLPRNLNTCTVKTHWILQG
jgi:hypothetical protein|tara:strand:+ start:72 stop:1700 length:1629 start_codon:yes stop_codon:yes gene_type:complete